MTTQTSPQRAMFLAVCCCALFACGNLDNGGSDKDVDPSPRAVGVDQFNCPIVDPTPLLLDVADYEQFCGDQCDPFFARRYGAPKDEGHWFVACTPAPSEPQGGSHLDVFICMSGPVDGVDYWATNSGDAGSLLSICWLPCGADGLDDPRLEEQGFPVPAYCRE